MTSPTLAKVLTGQLVDRPWQVKLGIYECPYCTSRNIARERLETQRYSALGLVGEPVVERTIRCMDCGEYEEVDK